MNFEGLTRGGERDAGSEPRKLIQELWTLLESGHRDWPACHSNWPNDGGGENQRLLCL